MKVDLYILPDEEKRIVKSNIKRIPVMGKSNPISKMIGAQTGDVIKIILDNLDIFTTSYVIIGK
jgi:DNA-directed RNA polymerase subunit H (RpoH/RPB5)